MILLFLACSCQKLDPELDAHREAVAAWEAGEKKLEAGDAAGARAEFAKAKEKRPEDILLTAWEAHAAAEAGDLDAAIELLDLVVIAKPQFGEAIYNRAAYRARKGEIELAASDLKRALASGVRRPREVLIDPDFQPHLEHPALRFLPASPLLVAVDRPPKSVFWGSEASFRLRISGAPEREIVDVQAAEASGPVELVSMIEDSSPGTDGIVRDLTWTLRVVGEGPVVVGPITVTVGRAKATVDAVTFAAKAPPDKVTPELPPLTLPTCRLLVGDHGDLEAWRADGRVFVTAGPTDAVRAEPPPAGEHLRCELRALNQPVWVLRTWPAPDPVTLTVRSAGSQVLDQRL